MCACVHILVPRINLLQNFAHELFYFLLFSNPTSAPHFRWLCWPGELNKHTRRDTAVKGTVSTDGNGKCRRKGVSERDFWKAEGWNPPTGTEAATRHQKIHIRRTIVGSRFSLDQCLPWPFFFFAAATLQHERRPGLAWRVPVWCVPGCANPVSQRAALWFGVADSGKREYVRRGVCLQFAMVELRYLL